MTFKHKLSKRLALIRGVMGAALVAGSCITPPGDRLGGPDGGPVTRIVVLPDSLTAQPDQVVEFVAVGLTSTGDTANVAVRWSVTDGTITEVGLRHGRAYGKYKPRGPGRHEVGAGDSTGLGDTAIVIVPAPVASVTVAPASAPLAVGQSVQLSAILKDSAGNTLTGRTVAWATSAPGVAAVSAGGLVTGLAAGSATITATSEGKSGTSTITAAVVPVASVTVSPASATIAVSGTRQLSATVKDSAGNTLTGRTVTWTSSNPAVATANGSGLVTGIAPGSATITAASEGKSGTGSVTVTSPPPPPPPPAPGINAACATYAAPAVPPPLRTFYVNAATGDDAGNGLSPSTAWRTLDQANAVAQAGDLFLLTGAFSSQIVRPATSGTASAKIVYRANGAASLSIGRYDVLVWLDGRSHIVVDGLELHSVPYAVQLSYDATNNWLRNLYVHDGGSVGFYLRGASDNRIEDSRIERIGSEAANSGDAVFIQDGSNRNVIVRNRVRYAGHGTIWISYQGAGEATADDNVIAHNDLANPWASGAGLSGKANRTIVECNRIYESADGTGVNYARSGIEIDGTNNVVRFNEIFDHGAFGLTIQGRTFAGFVQNARGNQVYHNTVWGNGNASIQIVQKDAGVVQDNVIENNVFWNDAGYSYGETYAIAADLYHANSVWPVGSANGNIVRYNIFPAGQSLLLIIRTAGNLSYTVAQGEATFAGWTANWQVDPLFVNLTAGDVRLQTGSPAIDAGRVIGSHPFQGSAPDLGAREY